MGGAGKLALGLLLLWIAMLCFFFAFHPNGVQLNGVAVQNPSEALQWLTAQVQATASGSSGSGGGSNAPTTPGPPGVSVQ